MSREVKKVIHTANFDRHNTRQAHIRPISLEKNAEELLLLMETINQKSN